MTSTFLRRQCRCDVAPIPNSAADHRLVDAQPARVGGGHNSPTDQTCRDAHPLGVGGGQNSATTDAKKYATSIECPRPLLSSSDIYMLAQFLDDIEGLRKTQANRRRILTAATPDSDGIIRGFGLDSTHPVVNIISSLETELDGIEHQTILALQTAMRCHPLHDWQQQAKGVGEKQLARLLGAIGDPYLREYEDGTTQPRTVSQLWAYCGLHTLPAKTTAEPIPKTVTSLQGQSFITDQPLHETHDVRVGGEANSPAAASIIPTPKVNALLPGSTVAAKRVKGQTANWSTEAKTRAWLIAKSCIQHPGSNYRQVYLDRRTHTAQTHPEWTAGHSHNDGLRILSKRILRDLWRAARDYHHSTETA